MKVVIVGCGRVGAMVAERMDAGGHEVVIIDASTAAFDRLPPTFKGSAIRADGTDADSLRRAGAEHADVFLALTEGDNRNVMAAQMAVESMGVERVVAKINDPVRAAAYADLGIATICRTDLLSFELLSFIGVPAGERPTVRFSGLHPHLSAGDEPQVAPGAPIVAAGIRPAGEA